MSEPNKYREWILETIDSLRSRKARPDLERICRMVRRRHGSDPDRTRTELEKLIEEQTVLKVSYKGSISYRNAAKVQRKSRKKSEFRPEPENNNNNSNTGDSALSLTDLEDGGEEGVEEEEEDREPRTANPAAGNANSGATDAEKASAPRETQSEPRGEAETPADTHDTSCEGKQPRQRQTELPRNKLGDRGHMKPLGLKEILGYLSSQERLSEEKLTRGKVKVVMEREVAGGRLRRTRCGNITLPLRRRKIRTEEEVEEQPHGFVRSALQDTHTGGKPPSLSIQENEPMETASEEEVREENREEEEGSRSTKEEGGLSLVAMTTKSELIEKDVEMQTASKQDSPPLQQQDAKGISRIDFAVKCSPLVQGAAQSQCHSAHSEGQSAVSSHQLHLGGQTQMQCDRTNNNSSGLNSLESKMEVSVSSCLLTPTASPRDSAISEEREIHEGVSNGEFMKSEGAGGSPLDWTVSDVVSYFTAAGFPEQAEAFGTQEIDGKSLLLMQRNDVLTGLSIRLGPALKIYERHIKVLQKTHFEEEDC